MTNTLCKNGEVDLDDGETKKSCIRTYAGPPEATGSRASYEMSTTTHSPIQYSSVLISTKYFSLREKDFESSQGKVGLADMPKLGQRSLQLSKSWT